MNERKAREFAPPARKKRQRRTIADEIFSAVVENAFDSILIVDQDSRIAYANPACEQIAGRKPSQLIGKKITDMIHADDAGRVQAALNALARPDGKHEGRPVRLEARYRHRNGQWLNVENIFARLDLPNGRGIVINARDISAQKRIDALLKGKTHLFEMIATTAPLEHILRELVLLVESQAEQIVGCIALLPEHAEPGQMAGGIQTCIAPSVAPGLLPALAHYAGDIAKAMLGSLVGHAGFVATAIDSDPAWEGYRDLAREHELRACWSLPILGQQARLFGILTMYSPVQRQPEASEHALAELAAHIARIAIERDRALRQVRYQAHHDELTGLPNRTLLRRDLENAIADALGKQRLMALMFIDLDHFKEINDTLGHQVGDLVLQVVAARLHHCLRQDDSVARLGGDEFVITLNALNHASEAAQVAGKVLASLGLPFSVDNHELHLGASIGISMFPLDGSDIDTLMRAADSAMYAAKASGRDNYQFFTPGLDLAIRRRHALSKDLRSALPRGEFSLQYQPQVDIGSARIFSAEALLRWSPHRHQTIAPSEFIPIAEESGAIVAIGDWVLREACLQLARWRRAGHAELKITINLSASQLGQLGFAEHLMQLLRESGLQGSDLQIDLHEETLSEPGTENLHVLHALSAAGVRLSIDDFGTGISNLAGLQRVPLHALKIDRSLVRRIGKQERNIDIIDAIIAMAHSLHLEVIAEGVETPEQAHFLIAHGCTAAQGFYFGRPASAAGFAHYLRRS